VKSKTQWVPTLGHARRQNISENQMVLEDTGSRGSIAILTWRALYLQKPVIHTTVNPSGPRPVLCCLIWEHSKEFSCEHPL